MKSQNPANLAALQEKATKLLAAKLGSAKINLIEKGTEMDAGSGKTVYRFKAAVQKSPNDPPASVYLTASGDEYAAAKMPATSLMIDSAKLKAAVADVAAITIDPLVNDLVLKEGDKFDETITVTVPANLVTPKADVYILADTTGSMSEEIASLKAGINSIVAAISGLGLDVAFGVGHYKDFPHDAPCFFHSLSPTGVMADINTAVNSLTVSGGSDIPEGQLFALDQIAKNPGNLIGWRNNAKKILVWFGDAPGHDPVCNSVSGIGYDITEASVTTDLQANKITVIAVSTTGGVGGLDGDPNGGGDYGACAPAGAAGQATRIAAATNGAFVDGVDATEITNIITESITATVSTINEIKLVPTGSTAPFVSSITPPSYGPLSSDVEHKLEFRVVFTGIQKCAEKEQEFFGTIDVVADGVTVAAKRVRIVVPPCEVKKRYTYVVRFIYGRQDAHGFGEKSVYRPGYYRTEIALHNDNADIAIVRRLLTVLVQAGATSGLNQVTTIAQMEGGGGLPINPDHSLMTEPIGMEKAIWKGLPPQEPVITSGLLKIVSDKPLYVSAIYTTSDLNGNGTTTNVETVEGNVTILS
ncbi:MAG: hypothetical protein R2791_02435 [Saprospiraceae bacterium]|nr:hypothetical protein [Lewinellaceae bacterium]